jgi:hypothetical protein
MHRSRHPLEFSFQATPTRRSNSFRNLDGQVCHKSPIVSTAPVTDGKQPTVESDSLLTFQHIPFLRDSDRLRETSSQWSPKIQEPASLKPQQRPTYLLSQPDEFFCPRRVRTPRTPLKQLVRYYILWNRLAAWHFTNTRQWSYTTMWMALAP